MKPFIARKKTILAAIDASANSLQPSGRVRRDERTIAILEGVLATGKINENIIQFYLFSPKDVYPVDRIYAASLTKIS